VYLIVELLILDGREAKYPCPREKFLLFEDLLSPLEHRVEAVVLVRGLAAGDAVAEAHMTGAKVLLILVAFNVKKPGTKQALERRPRFAAAVDLNPTGILCPIIGKDMEPEVREDRK
jgi:hypothetical protein